MLIKIKIKFVIMDQNKLTSKFNYYQKILLKRWILTV